MRDTARALRDLAGIAQALTRERDLAVLLGRILETARRLTRAEAGTLFLREGDHLHFTVVQNDFLEARLGKQEMQRRLRAAPLSLTEPTLAGHVALTGETINVADAYAIGVEGTLAFHREVDASSQYGTRSVFVVPLEDPAASIVGVLELVNARSETGTPVPFEADDEMLVRALASQAAIAIRNARLENVSFKDSLTDLYNERYFTLRLDEEARRSARFGHPLSLAFVDLDDFAALNEAKGHAAGDDLLREASRLLVKHSRSFTILARRGADDFAAILANTPKAGAVTYAERIRGVIERHPFAQGPVTACFGVAALPADAASAEDLLAKAEWALAEAKRLGKNRVGSL